MTGIDLNEAVLSIGQRGIIVVDGQDTTTALVVTAVTDMVALVPPPSKAAFVRFCGTPACAMIPICFGLKGLSERRLRAPDLSARP
jgi:hypothetical protein